MELTKIWQIAETIPQQYQTQLAQYPQLIAQLLYNRGINDTTTAKEFFSGDWQLSVHNPLAFGQMREAVELIIKHLKAGHKVAIAGDYDADGITSSAVLSKTIESIKGQVEVWIPSRLGEGYGLSKRIVDQVIASGAKLLITVDNGIRAKTEVAYAREKGLDVIVTDHHVGPEDDADLPDTIIIDPILPTENYPFRYLAGVGVAFKLVSALLEASTLTENQKDRLMSQVLDLVAIGTIADCVSLTGENRALVKRGLSEINKQLRPGIRSLIGLSSNKAELNEWHIGWQLAPRLNVAGRLDHASTALRLLTTEDQTEADDLATRLNNQNALRQTETARIVEHCERVIETSMKDDKMIILTSPDLGLPEADRWLEGVIGLVAGRLCEKYSRPTLVICQSEGQIKGSGRSIESVNIVEFLGNFKEYLARFGGHKMACGFTVKNKQTLVEFVEKARALAKDIVAEEDLCPRLHIDVEIPLAEVNGNLADQLEKFSPFGQGNPVPLFVSRGVTVMDLMPIGMDGQHLKLRFGSLWAVAWGGAKRWPELMLGRKVDIVYSIEWNEFNNYKTLQLKLADLKYAD